MGLVTIHKPHLATRLVVWAPKYSAEAEYGEPVALLHARKVAQASPVIIIEFKAKHLQGQRFAIRKDAAMRHELGTNGKADMYLVPMSHFDAWETAAEARDKAFAAFND